MSAIIFGLFIMVFINALSKSIREKRIIEDVRMRRTVQGERQKPLIKYEDEDMYDFEEMYEAKETEMPNISDYIFYEDNQVEENTYMEDTAPDSMDLGNKVNNNLEGKRTSQPTKLVNKMQKDLLRGIIFSEVLSEPKSVRTMRR